MDFKKEFEKKLAEHDLTYEIRGVITADRRVYPLGIDTKVLSSVFEAFVRPLIYEIAKEHGLEVREARAQNYYPDFTLMKDKDDPAKIAVDVKTTYRESGGDWKANFTLGAYTSFIREDNEAKNIEFPYSEYAEHWIIGFIYRRKEPEEVPAHIYALEQLDDIPAPFEDVDVFVQEKWKISGDRAGSGNTTNMGSIGGTLEDFREGRGVFKSETEFLEYWRGYERTAAQRKGRYSNIKQFRERKKKLQQKKKGT